MEPWNQDVLWIMIRRWWKKLRLIVDPTIYRVKYVKCTIPGGDRQIFKSINSMFFLHFFLRGRPGKFLGSYHVLKVIYFHLELICEKNLHVPIIPVFVSSSTALYGSTKHGTNDVFVFGWLYDLITAPPQPPRDPQDLQNVSYNYLYQTPTWPHVLSGICRTHWFSNWGRLM